MSNETHSYKQMYPAEKWKTKKFGMHEKIIFFIIYDYAWVERKRTHRLLASP